MGTRSNIARENADGSIDAIYCHWDGYPSCNGNILLNNYQDPEKIDQLIALGSISSLGEEIGEAHDFDARPTSACNAYGRDRGEKNVGAVNTESIDEYLKKDTEEYCYIFTQDKKWVYRAYSDRNLHTLTQAICDADE